MSYLLFSACRCALLPADALPDCLTAAAAANLRDAAHYQQATHPFKVSAARPLSPCRVRCTGGELTAILELEAGVAGSVQAAVSLHAALLAACRRVVKCAVWICTTAALPRSAAGKLQRGRLVDLPTQPLLHSKPQVWFLFC